MKTVKNYETYPLSPLQQGMLFHSLSVQGRGVDIEQIICRIHEPLELSAFERAWAQVINRHPILRSRFQWKGLDEPLQVVEPDVSLLPEYHNWRDLSLVERNKCISEFLHQDRLRDFKMTQAPLMRLTLLELGGSEYQFVWTFNHILLDGRSTVLILDELFGFYEAFIENRQLNLKQPRPYRDYIEWLERRGLAEDERYWRRTLSGFTAPTPIPIAHTVHGMREMGSGGAEELRLSGELTSALESFASKHDVTLNTLVQGSWALLLHHYSGEDDVIFGAVRAGRHTSIEGTNSMIGLFINTLPMRARLSADQTVLSYLKELRAQHLALRQYEHTPLQKIQQWSDIPPGTSLFESIVVFENYVFNSYFRGRGGNWLNREFLHRGRTNYPLTLIGQRDKEMLIRIEYDEDRFDKGTVQRMLGHIRILLEGMMRHAEKPISYLPILTEGEHHQILVEWNATEVDYPKDKCLHEVFEGQVERTPESVALVFETKYLSYRELNERVNQLGRFLRSLGVSPEVLVGVYMERSIEMVIALYGILKAGGAYVPLDPEYPDERVRFMLEDSQVPVLLTQEHLVGKVPDYSGKVVCLDSEWGVISRESSDNLESGATADNLAYVIYTSGSTGKPKGVMNTHRGICNRLLWMQEAYQLTGADRVLQKTTFSFDVSVWEFFWPLLFGARLVIAQPGGHRDSAYLVDIITKEGITTLHFVPSMLQIFLEEEGVDKCRSIRRVICSGEALPYELQMKFFERLDTELHNLYGPTEAAVDVTYWPCQRDSSLPIVPIGRPVANTQTYILNGYMQPVPIGVCGELHIGGVQVARGYLNRPELTAEKFIPDPFSTQVGAMLYKTGDLCRYLPDGNIEYLGRNDFQIKIRGLRIEIGEIEEVLTQHPEVREAVVVAREDVPGDKRLVAYLTGKQKTEINLDKLREFLKVKLPVYMVPAAFVQLETFPLTGSGKVNWRALPAPKGGRQTEKAYEAPKGRVEQIIAKIWQKVLEVEEVGTHDNFFDLGGHSLLLVRMRNRLEEHFEKEISIVDMFQRPTIKDLAKFLSDEQKGEPSFDRIRERAMKQKEILKRRRQVFERQGNPNE